MLRLEELAHCLELVAESTPRSLTAVPHAGLPPYQKPSYLRAVAAPANRPTNSNVRRKGVVRKRAGRRMPRP